MLLLIGIVHSLLQCYILMNITLFIIFIQFTVKGHLGYFQLGANTATMGIPSHDSHYFPSFSTPENYLVPPFLCPGKGTTLLSLTISIYFVMLSSILQTHYILFILLMKI